jgi:antitoxin MazE
MGGSEKFRNKCFTAGIFRPAPQLPDGSDLRCSYVVDIVHMSSTMKVKTIRIGNSQGIRIPKALIEQCRLGKTVELEVRDGAIVIRPLSEVRAGWADSFSGMDEQGDGALLDADSLAAINRDETEWRG